VRFATGENVSEIYSSLLCVSVHHQTGLVFIIVTVWFTFQLIYPMTSNAIFVVMKWCGVMNQV